MLQCHGHDNVLSCVAGGTFTVHFKDILTSMDWADVTLTNTIAAATLGQNNNRVDYGNIHRLKPRRDETGMLPPLDTAEQLATGAHAGASARS